MIEFCDSGPMSRVHLCRNGRPLRIGVADILSDAAAYVRSSRRPLAKRLSAAAMQVLRRLARETTLLFRIGVTIALIALGFAIYQQSRINALLRQQIETGVTQLEGFSRLLARVRKEALTPADLGRLHKELSGRMTTASKRLSELEQRSTAIARIIAKSRSSILFLQGAYAFREKVTGRMLRHAVGEDGKLLALPNGSPLLSLEGKGPVAKRQFTGTGFVLGDDGIIVTSRHLGQPWLYDVNVKALAGKGLEPVLIKFIAYFPDTAEAGGVALIRASKVADVAILRLEKPLPEIRGLQLAERPPKPGEEVIVIGYPTGIRSMLAQAGSGFIKKLQQEKETDFWNVAARLAAAGRIVPLASRGIVGRTSQETIVYDAETTYGGSGGPVLDINGSVVAINSAILPEYGGSNLGVPVSELRRLIAEAKSH
jgi:S1-C subfamily serine protease